MNILIVITNLNIGGAEKYAVNLSNSLANAGHNVTFCTIGGGGALKERLNDQVLYHELGNNSKITVKKILKLNRIIIENDIQIIHSHLFKSDLINYLVSIIRRKKNLIRISTEHSSSSRRKKYKVFGLLQRMMYQRFQAVTTISEDVRNHILEWSRVNKEKVITIYNGTDLDIKSNSEIINKVLFSSNDKFIIGSLTRLESRKDLETSLKAIHYLVNKLKVSNIEYIIYGDGPEKQKLQELAVELNISEYVVFAGFHSNIEIVIDTIDLHILSSKEEGFGISIIETMARGIPNIATKTGGIPEIITDNVEGFLFERGDFEGLAKQIKFFIGEKEKLIEFGIEAKNRVEKEFSFKITISNILTLYKSLIDNESLCRRDIIK